MIIRACRRSRAATFYIQLTAFVAIVALSACGRYGMSSEARNYDPRGLLDVFVREDLGLPDDLQPATEEIGGNQFGCDPGGCPYLVYIYPQDVPYTRDTCETWADTLEAGGYILGGATDDRVEEFDTPVDLQSPFQPLCQVYAQQEGDINVYLARVQGLPSGTSQWEIRVTSLYD